jgi:malonyl-CoA/methylmalonyl-CoA synthetase
MHPLFPALDDRPSQVALTVGDASLSRRELVRAARAHARRLADEGIGRSDRVALWATPDAATLCAVVGNALLGAVTVPLNPALGEKELAHVLGDSAPRLVLAADPGLFSRRTPQVKGIALDGPTAPLPGAGPSPDDPLLVLYTSGTTGAPKGAVISHRNAAHDLDALANAWAWSADDVLVHGLPLFHVHGLVLGALGPLRVGSPLRLLQRFSPEAVCAAFEAGGTLMFGVPTMYHRLAERCAARREDRSRLARARLLVSGSAPLAVREKQRLEALVEKRVAERYGLTETLILCAQRHDGERPAGCVGPPLPGIELRLVDDQRRPLSPGLALLGEVAVRGPTVFQGYLNRPDATAAAMDEDGFFYTGDLATLAEDGEVRIVGRRATDLIKTGGYKVGAGEVEAALLDHPAVREAAVIGAPDEDLGERIVAFVVTYPGQVVASEELAQHVARALAPHKRPRAVEIVEELPRNAMGKILKKQLASMLKP